MGFGISHVGVRILVSLVTRSNLLLENYLIYLGLHFLFCKMGCYDN